MSEALPTGRRVSLTPGTQVGRYTLLRRLARGGMAELYLARASGIHGFEKLFVLKLVLPHLSEDRRFVEMFLQEARMAAGLDHPHIAQVTDIGEFNDEPFFVMQYVHGRDLHRVAKTVKAPLPLDVGLTVAAQVAAGLHYVHERRDSSGSPLELVHRDVSPANVMIGYTGDLKLVDFGIAKSATKDNATRTGVIKGKISYLAPEQCRGDRIDRRTDVFALGILTYEMTTGRRLFPGDTDFAIMRKIVDGIFVRPRELNPSYPAALEAIIVRALEVEPDARYASAADMQGDLEEFAQSEGLRVSSLTLGRFMKELYGDQPSPAGADPLDVAPTRIQPQVVEPQSSGASLPSKVGLPTRLGGAAALADDPADHTGMVVDELVEELTAAEDSATVARIAAPIPPPEMATVARLPEPMMPVPAPEHPFGVEGKTVVANQPLPVVTQPAAAPVAPPQPAAPSLGATLPATMIPVVPAPIVDGWSDDDPVPGRRTGLLVGSVVTAVGLMGIAAWAIIASSNDPPSTATPSSAPAVVAPAPDDEPEIVVEVEPDPAAAKEETPAAVDPLQPAVPGDPETAPLPVNEAVSPPKADTPSKEATARPKPRPKARPKRRRKTKPKSPPKRKASNAMYPSD